MAENFCRRQENGGRIMKKFKLFLMLALCVAALFSVVKGAVRTEQTSVDFKNVLRMHILANSDSELDQKIKLAVRDAVLDFEIEETSAAVAETAEQAEKILREKLDLLIERAREVLSAFGVSYGVRVEFGSFGFPERNYYGTIYPAGNYRAVRIILGEGEGHNWWCVMFPPLCLLGPKDCVQEEVATSSNLMPVVTDAPMPKPTDDEPQQTMHFESLIVKAWKYIVGHFFGAEVENEAF